MSVEPDYTEFDAMLAERAIRILGMSERDVQAVQRLLKQGVRPEQLSSRMKSKYKNWDAGSDTLREIAVYLQNGRRDEE